jgi:hypothetical protein
MDGMDGIGANVRRVLGIVLGAALCGCGCGWAGAVKYAGVRAEIDGLDPAGWHNAVHTMAGYFPGAQEMIFMTASTVVKGASRMEFPADGKTKPKVTFAASDALEKYLAYYDKANIKAYLILRPGVANVLDLIELTLDRYKQHTSLAGIDVSLMYIDQADPAKYWEGRKVTDQEAQTWEAKVKSYNQNWNLVLMHWDADFMPAYRGSIIYGNESSEATIQVLTNEYKTVWAPRFAPNLSFFFIGAEEDRTTHGNWSKLANPTKEFGEAVQKAVDTDMGIFWIDVKGVLPTTPLAIARPAAPRAGGPRAEGPALSLSLNASRGAALIRWPAQGSLFSLEGRRLGEPESQLQR